MLLRFRMNLFRKSRYIASCKYPVSISYDNMDVDMSPLVYICQYGGVAIKSVQY